MPMPSAGSNPADGYLKAAGPAELSRTGVGVGCPGAVRTSGARERPALLSPLDYPMWGQALMRLSRYFGPNLRNLNET